MGQVDISRDLVLAFLLIPNVNDGCHSTGSDIVLPVGESLKEVGVVDLGTSMTERLWLLGVLLLPLDLVLLLPLFELLTGEDLSLAVVADLDQLPGELSVLQVEQILVGHLLVKIVLVLIEFSETVIKHVSIIVIVIHF